MSSDSPNAPRIRLRPLSAADAAPTAPLITPGVSRWTATWPPQVSPPEVADRIARTRQNEAKGLCVARVIERAADGSLMGWITAIKPTPEGRVGTLGYWIGEIFHGQGYMTEACRAFVALAWDGLGIDVLEAGAQPANTASIAILKRLGMRYIGDRDDLASVRGRVERCAWYALARV